MTEFRTWYERKCGERDSLQDQKVHHQSALKSLEIVKLDIEQAQVIMQVVAQKTQEKLKLHIEDLVTKALEAVFPDPYTFSIEFELKRNKTEAKLTFLRDGQTVTPAGGSGGGAIDVAALALRVALWAIGSTDNVLILDEPFRCLSREYQPLAGRMLKELSKQLSLQFIIVTHQTDLEDTADKVFKVSARRAIGDKYSHSAVRELAI